MALNYGALKTCADKLPANVAFNIFAIFLTAVQHMYSTQLREADSDALQHVKLGFLGQKFTLQINIWCHSSDNLMQAHTSKMM